MCYGQTDRTIWCIGEFNLLTILFRFVNYAHSGYRSVKFWSCEAWSLCVCKINRMLNRCHVLVTNNGIWVEETFKHKSIYINVTSEMMSDREVWKWNTRCSINDDDIKVFFSNSFPFQGFYGPQYGITAVLVYSFHRWNPQSIHSNQWLINYNNYNSSTKSIPFKKNEYSTRSGRPLITSLTFALDNLNCSTNAAC